MVSSPLAASVMSLVAFSFSFKNVMGVDQTRIQDYDASALYTDHIRKQYLMCRRLASSMFVPANKAASSNKTIEQKQVDTRCSTL